MHDLQDRVLAAGGRAIAARCGGRHRPVPAPDVVFYGLGTLSVVLRAVTGILLTRQSPAAA